MKLPVWRLITGLAMIAALATVLLMLAPIYLANLRLQRDMLAELAAPSSADQPPGDEALRQRVAGDAHRLALPVDSAAVTVSHPGPQTRVEIKYAVRKDFGLYQVDIHFHPSAVR